jgi:hypothetical protein
MTRTGLFLLLTMVCTAAQPQTDPSRRLNQHRVSNPSSPAPEAGAENQRVPSLVEGLRSPDDWYKKRRPEILRFWTRLLGKLEPSRRDRRWFGDVREARVHETREFDRYTRVRLDLPIEKDFYQSHLLLLPKNQGPGPFPAVVCWTSSTPDFTQPERWWGEWLAGNGYVVLTSWSFIRHYRDGSSYHEDTAGEKLRVDTGCLVALMPSVQYDIQYVGKIKTALFGGEGLFFASLTGPGKVWLQSLPFSRLASRVSRRHSRATQIPRCASWSTRWRARTRRRWPSPPTPSSSCRGVRTPCTRRRVMAGAISCGCAAERSWRRNSTWRRSRSSAKLIGLPIR